MTEEVKYITKRCNHCGELKPIEDFWKIPALPDGCQNECKECHKDKLLYEGEAYSISSTGYSFPPGIPGIPLVLVVSDTDFTAQDTAMCPACNDYAVRFGCTLETPEDIQLPILICTDCIYKATSDLIKFYRQGEMVYIVREYPIT